MLMYIAIDLTMLLICSLHTSRKLHGMFVGSVACRVNLFAVNTLQPGQQPVKDR